MEIQKNTCEPSQRYHRQILIDRQSRQRHIQGMMLLAAFNVDLNYNAYILRSFDSVLDLQKGKKWSSRKP